MSRRTAGQDYAFLFYIAVLAATFWVATFQPFASPGGTILPVP